MTFIFRRTTIPDVVVVTPTSHSDNRGFFLENYHKKIFHENGITQTFVQDNFSYSTRNVLRGMHYQKFPKAQSKFVSVVRGEIFDVAVDLRNKSPTYKKWVGEILSEKNHNSLLIPQGFAHGFCVLSDEAFVVYKVDQPYSQKHEVGFIWNDPELKISWPISTPILSEKDAKLPYLKDVTNN
jgi:dTDP-4-dehydrorhamnose 3,5-epimerase